MNTLLVPQGNFQLARYPERKHEQLRAWDAADAYLLRELGADINTAPEPSILIINDSFGALTVALSGLKPSMMSDSFLTHRGVEANLLRNKIPAGSVQRMTSLEKPDAPLDLVIIKIPKTLALLEDQLYRIRPCLRSGTRILAAGMVKTIHSSTLQLFERIIGPTTTSLAHQKARLIHCIFDADLTPGKSPYPTSYKLEGSNYSLINHANVFSREKLDIGTRLLLEHIPTKNGAERIVDLGCGNGVTGLIAAEKNPQAEIIFADESFMAVASAEGNFRAAFGAARKAEFMATNCLDGIAENSVDLIINNPPFHQQSAVGDQVAWEMFRMSLEVLKPKGQLLVVGNRHLGYHNKLKRLFGNCQVIGNNRKFVILEARKT